MTHRKAIYCMALAAIFFSTSGLLIKVISVSHLPLLGVRGAFAALTIALFMARPHLQSARRRPSNSPRPNQAKPRLRIPWSLPLLGGAISLVCAQAFFIIAVRETTAANAIFLQYTAPIFVAFFGIHYLRESVGKLDWLALAAVAAGLLCFYGDGMNAGGAFGNLFGLLAGLTFAWFLLFMRKQKDGSTIETVLLGNVLSALLGLPFLLGAAPTPADWLGMIFLGIFQIGLPSILIALAIKELTAVGAVLIQTLEPILNPVWVLLFIGEMPTPLALLGGAIVIGAVTFRSVLANRLRRVAAASQSTA